MLQVSDPCHGRTPGTGQKCCKPQEEKGFPQNTPALRTDPHHWGNPHSTELSSPTSSLTSLGQENMGDHGSKHQSRALLMSWQLECPCLWNPKLP